MLPGPRRIRRSADYRVVMRTGSRAASSTVVVHACATGSGQPARCGFVVGRSVGPAVVRNRVTRQLRHLMASHLSVLPAGMDIVVRALPPAADAPAPDLARDLSSGLRRAMSRLGHQGVTDVVVSP